MRTDGKESNSEEEEEEAPPASHGPLVTQECLGHLVTQGEACEALVLLVPEEEAQHSPEIMITHSREGRYQEVGGDQECQIILAPEDGEEVEVGANPYEYRFKVGDVLSEDKMVLSLENICEIPKTFSDQLDMIRREFNVALSLYNLCFGLVPTLWDSISDLRFGLAMETGGVTVYARMCYLCIIAPIGHSWVLTIIRKSKQNILILIVPVVLTVLFFYFFFYSQEYTFLFKYMAIIVTCFSIAVKLLNVVIHTEWMTTFSRKLTVAESFTESVAQLLLVTNLWLSGGELYLSSMVSSVLVIGKVSAETYLLSDQHDLLSGKSFRQRVLAVVKLLPFFSLTAIFRIGSIAVISQSLVPIIGPYLPNLPVGIKANIIAYSFIMLIPYLTIALIYMLRHCSWSTSLRQLVLVDIFQGSLGEASTTMVWGELGRERSKPIQLAKASFYFVFYNIFLVICALTSETSPDLTVSSYSISHKSLYFIVIFFGLISYSSMILHMYILNMYECSPTCQDSSGLAGLAEAELAQEVWHHTVKFLSDLGSHFRLQRTIQGWRQDETGQPGLPQLSACRRVFWHRWGSLHMAMAGCRNRCQGRRRRCLQVILITLV